MRLEVYKGGPDWLGLYAEVAAHQDALNFDQTPEWFEMYVMHVSGAPDRSLMLGVIDEVSNRLLLGMPLLSEVSGRLSIRHLAALSNYYTSLFQPISLASEHTLGDVVCGVVAALEDGSLVWDELSLEPMAGDTPLFCQLRRALEAHRYPHTVTECFTNWYLPVDGQGYELYEQSLPSKLRNTLRRKQKKLARELGFAIRIVQDDHGLAGFVDDYEAVYQKSWKSEESHPAFIRAIMHCFAGKGWLRLGLMYIDDEPVAAQLWFVKDGVASIYKLSYDQQYAKYSVGTILTAAIMKQVLDVDRVRLVDFLTGDDAYKKEWMSHSQERYRIRIYNRFSWRGRMLAFWNLKLKSVFRKS